jgi:hypothetical protein
MHVVFRRKKVKILKRFSMKIIGDNAGFRMIGFYLLCRLMYSVAFAKVSSCGWMSAHSW